MRITKILDSKYSSLSEADRKIYDDYVGQLQMRIRPNANVNTAEWAENWSEWRDPMAALIESAPIGQNQWGDVYQWKQGRHKEAARFLQEKQGGYLRGVFHRDGIGQTGQVDMTWGHYKGGLLHMIEKHIIRHADFENVEDMMSVLDNLISTGEITRRDSDGRYLVKNDKYIAVIAVDENGQWVLTSFDTTKKDTPDRTIEEQEKKRNELGLTSSSRPNETAQTDEVGATFPQSESVSTDKGTANNSISQERLDEIKAEIQSELDKKVFGDAPIDEAEIIAVTDPADQSRRGYIIRTDSGNTPTIVQSGETASFEDGDDIAYVWWEDTGKPDMKPLKDLDFVSRENAAQVAESMVTQRTLAEQGKQTFEAGQTVWYTDPNTGQTFDSRVVSVTDEGVEIEIEDENGNPNTLPVPHGVALTQIMTENPNAETTIQEVQQEPVVAEQEQPTETTVEPIQEAATLPTEPLSAEQADALIEQMEQSAEEAPQMELTPENWLSQFGEDGMVETPIGNVKMGENQYLKLAQKGREGKLGMIKPTLENPDVIIEDRSKAKDGQETERESSYVFVKAFVGKDGERLYYFTSITIKKDGREVVISNQEKERSRIERLLKEGKLAYIKKATLPPASDTTIQGDQLTNPVGDNLSNRKVSDIFSNTQIIPDPITMSVDELAESTVEFMDGNKQMAKDYLQAELDKAKRSASVLNKKKVSNYTNISDFKVQNNVLNEERREANALVSKLESAIVAANSYKTEAERQAEEEEKARQVELRAQRRQTEEGKTDSTPAERWNSQPKAEGNSVTRTLPDGTKIRGRYVLAEAGAATPSHDPFNGWNTSEGFPITEDGRNINDRDYLNDKDAQQITMRIAQTYDGQAVEQVPVVSSEGIVYDGNGRTIAGHIAAANNTDAAYLEALRDNAANFGFTEEQLQQYQHPRVYMQVDEDLPYNTTTFKKFNAQEKKTTSSTNRAVANSKAINEAVRDNLLQIMDNYGTLDAFFGSEQGAADMVGMLVSEGVITQQEVAGLTEPTDKGFLLSNAGKDYITDIMLGALFDENTIRMLGTDKALKRAILRALPQIVENRRLGEYALSDNINGAIRLLYEARKADMSYQQFVRQTNAFEGMVSDRYSPFEMLLAEEMQTGVEQFRQVLELYNKSARDEANGQGALFEPLTPEAIKQEIINRYGKQQPDQPTTAVAAAGTGKQERPASKETEPPVPSAQTGDGEQINENTQQPSAKVAATDKTPLDVAKTAIEKQKQQAEHRKQVQEYINQIAGGKYETVLWNTGDYQKVLTTELKKKGYSDDAITNAIQAVKNKLESLTGNDSMNGFFIGQQLFLNDDSGSFETFRSVYVHERQHGMTQEHPEWIREVMQQMSREELSQVVANLCNSTAYSNESHEVLADEYISMAMEKAYDAGNDEELEQILQQAGANNSLINFIKQLNDEQRKESSLSRARRNAHVNNHKQGSSGQNGRDPGTLPRGNLDEQGIRPAQQGTRGTESGGQGVEEPANSEKEQSGNDARFSIAQRDKEYKDAVEHGDIEKVQQMLQEEAERKGYKSVQDYKDAHRAPRASVEKSDFTNLDALRNIVEENGEDSNLFAVAQGISVQPDDYFSPMGARWYGYDDAEGMESYRNINKAINAIQDQLYEYGEVKDMPVIEVYRAVPKDIRGKQLESEGQWVSPSKKYAINHGRSRFGFNEYRIVKQEVPADQLWWDGNDIREWGFDDGTQNVYKNTTNNRKLSDVTYDENGELIPLSQRFNEKKSDVRFSVSDNRRNSAPSSVQREMDDIKAKAQANGTFMKAPNGEPTRLNERQWLQVRTQNFKRWFGDWEKTARIEKLRKSKPVEITGTEYKGRYELNRDSAQYYILNNLRGEYLIKDTGERVTVSKVGAKKVTSHSIGNEAHLKSIVAIPQLLENAIFIEEKSNEKSNTKYDSYRYYIVGLKIGSVDYTVRLTIGVKDGKYYYDHYLTEIEKGNLIEIANGFTPTGDAPIPSYTVGKDTRLFSILQTNSSKVVDENGEPMVVYHYTDYQFNVFGKEKQVGINTFSNASNALYASTTTIGDWFTTNRNQKYLHNPMELFLNIQNPYDGYSLSNLAHEIGNGISEEDAYKFEEDRENIQPIIDAGERFVRTLQSDGYDGVVINDEEFNGISYVTFSPNQIKSATDNTGAFDSRNDDIRFSIIGEQPLQPNETKLDYAQRVARGRKAAIESRRLLNDEQKSIARAQLLSTEPVVAEVGIIKGRDGVSVQQAARQWADENLPTPLVYAKEVGDVVIDKTSIKNSLSHGYSQAKLDAIPTLPKGFENATYLGSLDDHNRPRTANHYFAYPIEYNNELSYVFCRAKEDNMKNRLYVHEVFVANKINNDTLQTEDSALPVNQNGGAVNKNSTAQTFDKLRGTALYRAILSDILSDRKGTTDFSNTQEPRFSVSNNNAPTSRRQSLVGEMLRKADELNEQLKIATQRNADGSHADEIKTLQADYAAFMQAALKLMRKDLEGLGIRQLQGAQRLQKAYDKGTINALASYAQMFIQSGWAEEATKTEQSRLLGAIRNGATESDITSAVEKMFNLFTNTQLRQTKNIFKSLLKTPLQKLNISGVREQGKVDLRTQYAMQEIKSAIQDLNPDAIENRIAELQDKLDNTQDDALRVQYEAQIDGLHIAESYNNTVRTLEEEAKTLKQELADAKADKSVTREAKQELIASIERAMLDNEQDLIVAYQQINGLVADILKNGKLRAKSFIEEQKSRQAEIRHFAEGDLQGISPSEHVTATRQQRIDNSVLVSGGLFSPLGSLNSMLKRLAPNALGGRGYLYNHFIYGVVEASSNEAVGLKQALWKHTGCCICCVRKGCFCYRVRLLSNRRYVG